MSNFIRRLTNYAKHFFYPKTSITAVDGLSDTLNEIDNKLPDFRNNSGFIATNSEGGMTTSDYSTESFGTPLQGALAGNTIKYSEPQDITLQQESIANSNVSNRSADNISNAKGYKVLLPNYSFNTQIANTSNTIFEINDEFNLNNGSVTIPSNCTLFFNGGILKNGTIVGNSTRIISGLIPIFDNITPQGTWCVDFLYSEWLVNCNEVSFHNAFKNGTYGYKKYDSTLKRYVMWDGYNWVNLDGSPLTVYNITTDFIRVDSSNEETTVEMNKPYVTYLTPDEMFELTNVKVFMDNKDITSLTYIENLNKVFIPSVISNIKIVARTNASTTLLKEDV